MLVEGESDAGAVRAAASLLDIDFDAQCVEIFPTRGITNFSRALRDFLDENPSAGFAGLYDRADERYVRRALAGAGIVVGSDASLEPWGFFACDADLEDELIRALGATEVEQVIADQGELGSFRRFQAMPEHREKTVEQQLHRFMGTRATRKVRLARLLTEALGAGRLPQALLRLARLIPSSHRRR